ncbi:hypothetical protein H312_02894 [Anncaliia algerae PRA339]|uniref:Uncharacterized protein n=1 Tax=Anncaliia algerae PRA339 TaxID=1288291 RepID=A0A059EXF7_9MICR|nr:hypothetical protein H312_02894 [Anncaliia algerae PRA339]
MVTKSKQDAIIKMTGHSDKTISKIVNKLKALIYYSLKDDDMKIGGEGVVVELGESKFGKRKYNRGHRVEGAWVFGGVERTPEDVAFYSSLKKEMLQLK